MRTESPNPPDLSLPPVSPHYLLSLCEGLRDIPRYPREAFTSIEERSHLSSRQLLIDLRSYLLLQLRPSLLPSVLTQSNMLGSTIITSGLIHTTPPFTVCRIAQSGESPSLTRSPIIPPSKSRGCSP